MLAGVSGLSRPIHHVILLDRHRPLLVRSRVDQYRGRAAAQIIIAAYMKVFRPPEPKEIEWPEKFEPL